MNLSGIVIGVCGIPWVVSGFAAFQKLKDIYSHYPELPRYRRSLGDPIGLRRVRTAAVSQGLDQVIQDLNNVARYRLIELTAFGVMLVAFLIDFSRNAFL